MCGYVCVRGGGVGVCSVCVCVCEGRGVGVCSVWVCVCEGRGCRGV